MSRMHPLQDFRESAGLSRLEFAKRLGVTEVTVWRWELGHRTPRGKIMEEIRRETGGAITANDFMQIETAQ